MAEADSEKLLGFLRTTISMSGRYQPLIIAQLARRGGHASREQLAEAILLSDAAAVARADDVLMRWPRRTLAKHDIASYDAGTKSFRLHADLDDDARDEVVAACEALVEAWNRPAAQKRLSRRFAAIRRAQGRCQACGITALSLAAGEVLDVDHIVPRSHRSPLTGKVRIPGTDTWIDVDDERNLQVLCPSCNRGKRDADTYDFRARPARIADAIAASLALAAEQGTLDAVLASLRQQHPDIFVPPP